MKEQKRNAYFNWTNKIQAPFTRQKIELKRAKNSKKDKLCKK